MTTETLKPADRLVLDYLTSNASISAQEAFLNLKGMSSATLARRITTITRAGYDIVKDRQRNPITEKLYTRYALADNAGVLRTVQGRLI